jgi:hypothetical protein
MHFLRKYWLQLVNFFVTELSCSGKDNRTRKGCHKMTEHMSKKLQNAVKNANETNPGSRRRGKPHTSKKNKDL